MAVLLRATVCGRERSEALGPMPKISATRKAVQAISSRLASSLKPAGFRRRAPHLWRDTSELLHIINFQASQWGSAASGRFTINVCVTNRELYECWMGRSFPTNPGAATWPIAARIGDFQSGTDTWWDVDGESDLDRIGGEVLEVLEARVLPWLDSISTLPKLDAALARVKKYGDVPGVHIEHVPLMRAVLSAIQGDDSATALFVAEARENAKGEPFAQSVEKIAVRLGVNAV